MTERKQATPRGAAKAGPPPARWDGRRILFDVVDGDRTVACAISMNALQDLSEQRRFKPADLLTCFAGQRARIEAIALGKLRGRSGEQAGLLNIWSDDVEDSQPRQAAKA